MTSHAINRKMKARLILLYSFVAFAVTGFLHTSVVAGPWEGPRVALTSYGKVRIGMTPSDVRRALRKDIVEVDSEDDRDGAHCRHLIAQGENARILYMFLDDRLARIQVLSPSVMTISGIHVGSTKKDLLKAYGRRAVSTPHAYSDGEYLTVLSRDGKYGIRFEVEVGVVDNYYAGTAEAIGLAEGCS